MKNCFFMFALLASFVSSAQVRLSGLITSKVTGEGIPGAVVYLPDYKAGAVTDNAGKFMVEHVPEGKTMVVVRLIGFRTEIRNIEISAESRLDLQLEESVIEENEVVVTGVSRATDIRSNPMPMVFVDSKYLQQTTAVNVIDALVKVPGVNAVSTGPNVSKPYIRGLGGTRVLNLFNGVRQEGQQWGEEHGVEIDQFLIDRVEVVKGPASLIYGSDALGGVVNMLPANTSGDRLLSGDVQTGYHTNNGLRYMSAGLSGNAKGFSYFTRGTFKQAADYRNSIDDRVYNTGFTEKDLSAGVGLNRKWGYTNLSFSSFDNLQEIPDGSRDSATRKFTRQISEEDSIRPIVSASDLSSYKISDIHQYVQHMRVISASNFVIRRSRMALTLGMQNSQRREYAHPEHPSLPGLSLKLNTLTYDLKWHFPEISKWETTAGLNGMLQQNSNSGTDFVIPDYKLFDFAPFVFARRNFGKWDLAFGARYDTRSFNSYDLYVRPDAETGFETKTNDSTGAAKRFTAGRHSFGGVTGSFGATYRLSEKLLLKANVARGYRAPNVTELTAAGVHPGTGYQQLGESTFRPEFSLQEDIAVFFDAEHISAAAEIFYNVIDNYIFNEKLSGRFGGDSVYTESGNDYQVFKFRQTKAQLYGGEARIDIHPHPLDWLHFENSVSFVNALNLGGSGAVITHANRYLPFIPPLHSNSELRAEFRKRRGAFASMYLKIGLQYYAAQNRIYSAYDTETSTPAYTLLDAGAGATIVNRNNRELFSIAVLASNLADVAYQSNMSRLKYFEEYPGNASGRSGIYNMGRNVGFRLTVPLKGGSK